MSETLEKILPCPICYEDPTDFMEYESCSGRNISYEFEVRCANKNCYLADGADYHFGSKEEAIKAWNEMPRIAAELTEVLQKIADGEYDEFYGPSASTIATDALEEI